MPRTQSVRGASSEWRRPQWRRLRQRAYANIAPQMVRHRGARRRALPFMAQNFGHDGAQDGPGTMPVNQPGNGAMWRVGSWSCSYLHGYHLVSANKMPVFQGFFVIWPSCRNSRQTAPLVGQRDQCGGKISLGRPKKPVLGGGVAPIRQTGSRNHKPEQSALGKTKLDHMRLLPGWRFRWRSHT